MTRVVGLAVVVAVLVAASLVLRERVETRHDTMPPESTLVVEATAHVRGERDLAASLARALVSTCMVEADGAAAPPAFVSLPEGRFRFSTRPALDEPDRRQLRGCLEDLRIPHLKVTVQRMTVLGGPDAGAPRVTRATLHPVG